MALETGPSASARSLKHFHAASEERPHHRGLSTALPLRSEPRSRSTDRRRRTDTPATVSGVLLRDTQLVAAELQEGRIILPTNTELAIWTMIVALVTVLVVSHWTDRDAPMWIRVTAGLSCGLLAIGVILAAGAITYILKVFALHAHSR